jgi:hypothetical protein
MGHGFPQARTAVAILGTLVEFHPEPLPYYHSALVRLVTRLRPDLLCLDITRRQWDERDFGGLPEQYRNALLPLAHQTDMVVVPVAGDHPPPEPAAPGVRGALITRLRGLLARIQRAYPGPSSANQGLPHLLADLLYEIIAFLSSRETRVAWKQHTEHLTQHILDVAQRDPGCRVLAVLNVRHCHHVRRKLRRYAEVKVVRYLEL